MPIRFISLFSGLGGAELAFTPLGWECVAVSEVDPAACAVLAHHWPDAQNLGDVTKITENQIKDLGHLDAVIFGFPCQDLSVAGKRAGLKGKRSGLFFEAMRVVRWSGARWAIAENVPGLFSSNGGRDFAAVVGEMAGIHVDVPKSGWRNSGFLLGTDALVEWAVLDAQFFGVPQRRRRVFVVGHLGDWRGPAAVLFDQHCLSGHPPPRRETGKGFTHELAPSLTSSGRGVERGGDSRGQDPVVAVQGWGGNNTSGPIDVATACNAHGGPSGRMDFESETFITGSLMNSGKAAGSATQQDAETGMLVTAPVSCRPYADRGAEEYGLITHSLRAEGFDASEDGTGRGTPLVPVIAPCLTQNYGKQPDSSDTSAGPMLIPVSIPDVAMTMTPGGEGARGWQDPVNADLVAFNLRGREGGSMAEMAEMASVRAASGGSSRTYVAPQMVVRRLTPTECERLQGLPDGHTQVPYHGKPMADGPRYKMIGNGFAIPVVSWIGSRIQQVEDLK